MYLVSRLLVFVSKQRVGKYRAPEWIYHAVLKQKSSVLQEYRISELFFWKFPSSLHVTFLLGLADNFPAPYYTAHC